MSENFEVAYTVGDKLADDRLYLELHAIVCCECDFSTGAPSLNDEPVHTAHNNHYDHTQSAVTATALKRVLRLISTDGPLQYWNYAPI